MFLICFITHPFPTDIGILEWNKPTRMPDSVATFHQEGKGLPCKYPGKNMHRAQHPEIQKKQKYTEREKGGMESRNIRGTMAADEAVAYWFP